VYGKTFDNNIGFQEKRQFFAENSDNSINAFPIKVGPTIFWIRLQSVSDSSS
jgi:hypothetical protein